MSSVLLLKDQGKDESISLRTDLGSTTILNRGFSPYGLFLSASEGVWYDPNDLTTVFTDTAGTTPATVGSAVALMLDKSKGLVLGPERISNGDFSNGSTSWILDTGWAVSSGQATFTAQGANRAITQTGLTASVAGRVYEVSYTVVENTLNAGLLRVGAFSGSSMFGSSAINLASTVGPQVAKIFVSAPSGTGTVFDLWVTSTATSGSITIDNISVRELPGNHATQSTLGNRPILSREPATGRRNLLTYSNDFANAVWIKRQLNSFAVAAGVADPAGTNQSAFIVPNTTSSTHGVYPGFFTFTTGVAYTYSVYAKAGGYNALSMTVGDEANFAAAFNLTSGTVIAASVNVTPVIEDCGGGWFRCSVRTVGTGLLDAPRLYVGPDSAIDTVAPGAGSFTPFVGDGTSGVYLYGAQLETGSTATAYQKVVTARDVTEAGVADRYYLFFDGSDDWLVTPTITPGTDKVQVFAGVRKLSDAATAFVLEFSADLNSNNGSFYLAAPIISGATRSFGAVSKGTSQATTFMAGNTIPAPVSAILTHTADISGDVSTLRANGTQVAQVFTDQGTGNFLAYPLYIGRRGGTSLPFNGHLYGLIVRFGANLGAANISAAEAYMADNTPGVTL